MSALTVGVIVQVIIFIVGISIILWMSLND